MCVFFGTFGEVTSPRQIQATLTYTERYINFALLLQPCLGMFNTPLLCRIAFFGEPRCGTRKKAQRAALNQYDELLKRVANRDSSAVQEVLQFDQENKLKGQGEFKGKRPGLDQNRRFCMTCMISPAVQGKWFENQTRRLV